MSMQQYCLFLQRAVDALNGYMSEAAFWDLLKAVQREAVKSEALTPQCLQQLRRLGVVMWTCLDSLHVLAVLHSPVVSESSQIMLHAYLGVPDSGATPQLDSVAWKAMRVSGEVRGSLEDSTVGKSAFVDRFCDDSWNTSFITTIGMDFRPVDLEVSGKRVKLQIWDTAGQERISAITASYYRGAHSIILVYDVTNPESVEDFDRVWMNEVLTYARPDVRLLLIGNKVDLEAQFPVEAERTRELVQAFLARDARPDFRQDRGRRLAGVSPGSSCRRQAGWGRHGHKQAVDEGYAA